MGIRNEEHKMFLLGLIVGIVVGAYLALVVIVHTQYLGWSKMSKMSDLYMEVEQMLAEGEHPARIARRLGIPLSMVYDVLESMPAEDEIATEVGEIGWPVLLKLL